MTAPTVGVVVPTLNNAETVAAALRSAIFQSRPPDRVVVVDGGSRDGTVAISQSCDGVSVVHQTGRGLGSARNEGVELLDTDLIAFCDGDDQWTPDSLSLRMSHLVAHPGCDAVTGQYVRHTPGSACLTAGPADGSKQGLPGGPAPDMFRPALTPGGVLIRRESFGRVGPFATNLAIATDSDWLIRMRQMGLRLDIIDDLVLVKGQREASLSTDVATYRAELLSVARAFVGRRR
jgi:glycosyltransferase involved in cell wall biosynthesis